MLNIKKKDIDQAHQRIKPYIHKTPLLSSSTLSKIAKVNILDLKCENLQKVGAFKPRGVTNKLLQLDKSIKSVCTHSSGNHAQAMAYISSLLGFQAYIIMPQNSPQIKKNAVRQYGAQVIQSGNTIKQRQDKCQQIKNKYNAFMVHPYNDYDIIIGQGTSAKQVFQQKPNFYDYIVFPIGGGGLASGTLLATKFYGGKCKPIGVQPYLARDAKISLQKGEIQPQFPPISVADGLRTSLGDKTFQIIRTFLTPDDVIIVSQEQIIKATQLIMERMKIVVQPSSASVVAAVIKDERFKNKNVCCLISGGNFDMGQLYLNLKSQAKL